MGLRIQLLIDNPHSWTVAFAKRLCDEINRQGHQANLIHKHDEVQQGDILCLLGCEKIFRAFELNQYNLIVHESDLPKGRGMSPFTWQIVEGHNKIVVSLLEAEEKVDSGCIYDQIEVELEGHELAEEWRLFQWDASRQLIMNFLKNHPYIHGKSQIGEPSYYRRRNIEDSRIDPEKSISEQFNLLRVVDNKRYPAWFEYKGHRYSLKIQKEE